MGGASDTPDMLAKKWFWIAFAGVVAYTSAAFYFVLMAEVEPSDTKPVVVLHD